ncbi:MAG: ubiquinol-cytochrome c reductase iron-sulfur subunit [Nitrospinota bacterium]
MERPELEEQRDWSELSVGRRLFINGSLLAALAAAAAGAFYPLFRYLFPVSQGKKALKIETFRLSAMELPVGEARFFKFKRKVAVLIRKNEQQVIAMSAVCTHLGCIVKFSESDWLLKCPCHGAIFDLNGKVLAGPAPLPLELYGAVIENNEIIVTEA